MERRRRTEIVFTVVFTVRCKTANRNIFAHQAQIDEDGTHITASDHFHVFHMAQVMVVAAIRAHDTAPGIAHEIIVCTERHLEHGQMLVVDIGVTDVRIDVLVQFRAVAVPNKFTLMAVIQILDVGTKIISHAARRRRLVPRQA